MTPHEVYFPPPKPEAAWVSRSAAILVVLMVFAFTILITWPKSAHSEEVCLGIVTTDAEFKANTEKNMPQIVGFLFNGPAYTKFMEAVRHVRNLPADTPFDFADEAWAGVFPPNDPKAHGVGVLVMKGDCYQNLNFGLNYETFDKALSEAFPEDHGQSYIYHQPEGSI